MCTLINLNMLWRECHELLALQWVICFSITDPKLVFIMMAGVLTTVVSMAVVTVERLGRGHDVVVLLATPPTVAVRIEAIGVVNFGIRLIMLASCATPVLSGHQSPCVKGRREE